CQSHNSHPWTL
nr:immunoglobulin light chain junction region [Macaca mulatta]MOW55720.1 immunoglobulin light chain junction region [Macaca mulatta]